MSAMPMDLAIKVQRISQGDLLALQEAWVQVFGTELDMSRPVTEVGEELVVAIAAQYGDEAASTASAANPPTWNLVLMRRVRWACAWLIPLVGFLWGSPLGVAFMVGWLAAMLVWTRYLWTGELWRSRPVSLRGQG